MKMQRQPKQQQWRLACVIVAQTSVRVAKKCYVNFSFGAFQFSFFNFSKTIIIWGFALLRQMEIQVR